MKQAELNEHRFEYRGMSRLTAFTVICGPSEFHYTDENQRFLNQKFQRIWDLTGKIQITSC